jgi:hypothetical protein
LIKLLISLSLAPDARATRGKISRLRIDSELSLEATEIIKDSMFDAGIATPMELDEALTPETLISRAHQAMLRAGEALRTQAIYEGE